MAPLVYFSFPAHGHVNPTLGVVRELVGRGEQIIYYSTRDFERVVGATGAEFRTYPARLRMPERGPGPFARLTTTLQTLLDSSCAVLDEHLLEVRQMCPAAILFDSFAPWGRMVAQLLGVPAIASVPSILIDGEIDARYGRGVQWKEEGLTPEWYTRFCGRLKDALRGYGFDRLPSPPDLLQSYGDGNVVYTSRQFQPMVEKFDAGRFRFVGPCLEFRPEAPEFPFERLDGRPLVLISLGTVYGNARFFRACLEELADAPWQVVLAGGEVERAPENCMVRERVPQIELLKRAAVFVTHAGMNSVQEALYFGVPMVLVPQAADQFWIAARTRELGAGVLLQSSAIRAAVEQILEGAEYAERAARIGASLRAAGGAARAADEIQRVTAEARGHGGKRAEMQKGASERPAGCGADALVRGRPKESRVDPGECPAIKSSTERACPV